MHTLALLRVSKMLSVEHIEVHYGQSRALHDISLNVQEGELVALLGANGAGKTTTLSAIAGVVGVSSGTITFEGNSLLGTPPEAVLRKGIALVPEGREIFAGLTVHENLKLGAYIHRKNTRLFAADVEEMSRLFPILGERMNQPAGTLSGGEQQQLAIARALMSHPRLLMLDEPSLGLAPRLVEDVFRLIVKLHQQGTTILLVEQNVSQSLKVADRAYLVNMGRVEASGTPDELGKRVNVEQVYFGAHSSSGQLQTRGR